LEKCSKNLFGSLSILSLKEDLVYVYCATKNSPAPLFSAPQNLAKGEEEARWMPRVHASYIMAEHRATILKKLSKIIISWFL